MNLSIDSRVDDVCQLSLSGEITKTVVASHQDPFSQLLGQDELNLTILLSLEHAKYINSSGIGWLIETNKKIREAGGILVLHSLPPDIQSIFVIMRLEKVFTLAKDLECAQVAAKAGKGNG